MRNGTVAPDSATEQVESTCAGLKDEINRAGQLDTRAKGLLTLDASARECTLTPEDYALSEQRRHLLARSGYQRNV
ncbi:hypothetical protein [Cypionkella sp.]|uniref:hypothetical protein n=1 Tax=Cypionkella sp. TaxID=2811411 RepID=UPI002623FFAB|nr:hypothetical protein [Cypionkella sp.]